MEKVVIVTKASEYKEVETTRRDGSKSLLKVREFEMRSGKETFKGSMFGALAEDNKNTQYDGAPYIVNGEWNLREFETKSGDKATSNDFRINSLMPL